MGQKKRNLSARKVLSTAVLCFFWYFFDERIDDMNKFKRRPVAAAVLAAILFTSGISGCQKGENRIESQETAVQATPEIKGKEPEDGKAEGGKTETGKTKEEKTEADVNVETKDSVIVVMGPTSEPEAGFDPAYGWGAGEHVHEPLIQSTLTVTTKDLRIDYDLATDMKVSEDGLTWTVTIRDDVKFTDGEALNAGDVAFTYNTLRDTSSVNDFTMLKEAAALDDTTVEFRLNRP